MCRAFKIIDPSNVNVCKQKRNKTLIAHVLLYSSVRYVRLLPTLAGFPFYFSLKVEDVEKQGERDPEEKPLIKNEINIAVTHSEEKKTISFEEKLEGKTF